MWRALAILVVLLIGIGLYSVVAGGASPAAAPEQAGPSSSHFGFALAAGAVALAAVVLMNRPKFARRR